MASGSASRTIRAPGRLVVSPTNLSAAYPHGGTEAGRVHLVSLVQGGQPFRVMSEGLGEATDILEPTSEWFLGMALRGWDDDAITGMFGRNSDTGSASSHSGYIEPGTSVPGLSAIGRAKVLLYKPDDHVHVPSVLVYRGIPWWTDGAEVAFSAAQDMDLPVAVHCMRDASGNTLAVKMFSDLSLS